MSDPETEFIGGDVPMEGDEDDMDYSSPDEVGKEVELTTDGGVKKTITTLGTGWETPEKGDTVTVHYTGTLEDGTQFDSSRDRDEPFVFTLGQGQVIRGWDECVGTMRRGERCRVVLSSEYGYGASGSPPKIPGGATLVFDIELLSWRSVKDLRGDGGVIKTVVTEGAGWAHPGEDDEVRATIRAWEGPEDGGAPLYESAEGGDAFVVREGRVCRAVGLALTGMKKGETARLAVKAPYTEGAGGGGAAADPESLTIEVTLHAWCVIERVTADGAVVKKTVEESEDWQRPNAGARVVVTLVARELASRGADGADAWTVFDEHAAGEPLEFETDADAVPEGLEAAVMKMKKGERALVRVTAPEYAYGGGRDWGGAGLRAPARGDAEVEWEVGLVSFVKAKEGWEMSAEEKLAAATRAKERGNAAYAAGRAELAAKRWSAAEELVKHDEKLTEEERRAARALRRAAALNLAAAYLKTGEARRAVEAATRVLDMDADCVKALYRRAAAHVAEGEWVEAERDIRRGLDLEPTSTDLRALHRRWKTGSAAAIKKEASLYASMFRALGNDGKRKEEGGGKGGVEADETAAKDGEVAEGEHAAEPEPTAA